MKLFNSILLIAIISLNFSQESHGRRIINDFRSVTENLITPNSFDNLDNIYDANNNIISKVKTDVKKTNSNREIH